jgi:response regulator NasT
LLAQGPSRRLLDEALEGGVMACLIEPVRQVQLASTLDLAVARYREMQGLRQALADRKVIERAKGLLMAREGMTEDEAFRRLRRSSMDTQRPLADTARAVLGAEVVAASV